MHHHLPSPEVGLQPRRARWQLTESLGSVTDPELTSVACTQTAG